MKNEIEMIADEYIVQSSIEIGDYRYIFARHKDENEKHPYMKCREKADGFLCYYDKSIVSDDYIELMRLYIQDLSEAVEQLDKDRKAIGLEDIRCLKSDELLPVDYKMNIKGKVVAIDEKYLYDGRTDISHQLYLVQSGNGVYPESRGNGCFGYNLYTGKKARIERYEIIGIVPEEKMPEFAKRTLAKIKEEKEKEDR